MNQFRINFDIARVTPFSGLPGDARDGDGNAKTGAALIAGCAENFTNTAHGFIPGVAIKQGQTPNDLVVTFPGGRDAVNTMKSIPGPFTFERL